MKLKSHFIVIATLLSVQATTLRSWAQPIVTNQPQSQTNIPGATVMFTVGAIGTPPLSYQWRSYTSSSSFTNIPFGAEATLVLTNVQPTNRRFAVVVTDADGLSVTSSPLVSLTILGPPLVQPTNATASLFADVKFTSTVAAARPVSYQWLLNGAPIAGAMTNSLSVTNVQKTNAGEYALVATYAFGAVTSDVARLTIVPFNSMYCFGFSWTATQISGLDPTEYYNNRACNGPMWPEFLSTNLGLPYVERINYAIGGSGPLEILDQVLNFPAPEKPRLSLYCLMHGWGGRDTNENTWNQSIQTDILTTSNAIARLYVKGARAILIESQFVIDTQFRHDAGTNVAPLSRLHEFVQRDNAGLFEAVSAFAKTRTDLRIVWVDMHSQLDAVVANPSQHGFTKADIDALDDPSLTNQGPVSFTGPGADYVFWDYRHGTSKLHKLITTWHLDALTNSILERLDVKLASDSPNIQMNHLLIGRDYTLERSTDLSHWSDVHSFTAAAGTNQVTQATTGEPTLFYRLKWQP